MSGNQPLIIKKVKKGGHGGHHGGSWKVAYADFVTAMMAFFMVMWIMGLSAETRKSIQSYFNDPVGFMQNDMRTKSVIALSSAPSGKPTQGKEAQAVEQRALEKTQQEVEKEVHEAGVGDMGKDVKVTLTDEGLKIEFVEAQGAVFFESGSATIRTGARPIVERLAKILTRLGKPLDVEGHTDAAPFAGPGGNFGLSASRATALMQLLNSDGMPESQFRQVVGYGATKLQRPEAPLDFSNRRVTILVPREAKGEDEPPASSLRDKLRDGRDPEAVDLRPRPVSVKGEGERSEG